MKCGTGTDKVERTCKNITLLNVNNNKQNNSLAVLFKKVFKTAFYLNVIDATNLTMLKMRLYNISN